jgi:hypothetical protein
VTQVTPEALMFIAELFTIAQLWKQQKCCVFIHHQFYSATKKNEILLFAGKWMILANIILSEEHQVPKD